MKNLYRLQTLLVGVFSLLALPWASSQLSEPQIINVKNSGSSFVEQFQGASDYFHDVIYESNQLGTSDIQDAGNNNFTFTFVPDIGAVGTTDVIITYYSASAPMHPVTKSYRFNIVNEIVTTGTDRFLVDVNSTDVLLDVLANDSVPNGSLTLTTVAVVNGGSAVVNATGDGLLFTPDADFFGDAWLQYIACDSAGNCNEGKVHVLVRDPNALDNIQFQKFLLNQEELEILTPYEDFDLSINPANGAIESVNAITWNYTPNEGFIGNDTLELSHANQTVRKYIITVYSKPVSVQAKDDRFYVRPGLSVTFNVLNNDLLDDYEIQGHTNPTKGVLNEIGNGMFTYTPTNPSYRGVDKFTYTTCFEDTVYCETATVLLHVTDLEPENQFTYTLQTSKDLPLTIDYPIAYTDFSYIISAAPQHGELVFHEGVQQINLPCDTLESYNMLVYTPDAGYTGEDHFEYYYCVQPSNVCFLVKSDINVVEEPEAETCPCVVDCVWPGDGNLDGRVDMSDLLSMGFRLGETGPSRSYLSPATWFGQHANNWPTTGNATGVQYLDGNGDGAITANDVEIISDHYYKVHDVVVRDVQQKLPYQFSIIPVQFGLDSGDVVILDISIGTANVPVLDMKGAKFSVNVPPFMMDSSTVEVDFHDNSWLAEGSPNISLGKVPWDGRIDAGFAKANGNGSSGFGVIATIVFIIEDDIEGFKTGEGPIRIPITIESGVTMDGNGTLYDVEGHEAYIILDPKPTNANPYNLVVYPNPAQDFVNVFLNGKSSINSIDIVDPQGRHIRSIADINSKQAQVDISSLPVGLYYVTVHHEYGVMTQVLSVIR